mmetsp:Transcript_9771/g.18949  ORF Transcript_9771/g.18949 Transcript_9771/m.18949 type:complete len:448 (+) Transcript_9771:1411-2754(+)
MRDHDAPTGLLREESGVDGFCNGTDLVHLEEQSVTCLLCLCLLDSLDVCHQQIVPHNLDLVSLLRRQQTVPIKVILIEWIFNRHHWVLLDEALVEFRQFLFGHFELPVVVRSFEVEVVAAVGGNEELRSRNVHTDLHFARVTSCLDGFRQQFQSLIVLLDVRGEPSLVSHVGRVCAVLLLDHRLQTLVDLCDQTDALRETRGACGEDHELLHCQLVACMRPSVDDVAHRHRQHQLPGRRLPRKSSHVLVQRHALRSGTRSACSHGDPQNCVGTQDRLGPPPLVLGSVESLHHQLVDFLLVLRVHALEFGSDDFVDVLHSLQDALPPVPPLVAVPELQSLVGSCGGATRHSRPVESTGCLHVHLYCGVSSGVQNLSCPHFLDEGRAGEAITETGGEGQGEEHEGSSPSQETTTTHGGKLDLPCWDYLRRRSATGEVGKKDRSDAKPSR